MTDDREPKLYSDLKYGGDCPLCGERIEPGNNGWLYQKKAWCSTHKKVDIIEAAKCRPEALREGSEYSIPLVDQKLLLDALNAIGGHLSNIHAELTKIREQGAK